MSFRRDATNALVVFAKYPQTGSVKTRLATSIGAKGAAALYRQFILHILRKLADKSDLADLIVAVSPEGLVANFSEEFPGAMHYVSQAPVDDLGDRMRSAIVQCRHAGYRKIVIIGTDSPTLPVAYVERAFQALDSAEVVLGPAEDGGYYLIGVQDDHPDLFAGIAWSTGTVLAQTLHVANNNQLSYTLLDAFYDVDDLDGLRRLYHDEPAIIDRAGVFDSIRQILHPQNRQDGGDCVDRRCKGGDQ